MNLIWSEMAEREGFEPSMGDKTHTPLAGERLQPLGHLSVSYALIDVAIKIGSIIPLSLAYEHIFFKLLLL